MKAPLFALTALFFLLATTSCQKKPTASFSTDKEVYSTRDEVRLTNTSTDAAFYTWIVKGPEEIRGSDEEFSFSPKQVGSYEISLSVYSKNGKIVSKTSKTIEVRRAVSSYVFYTEDLDNVLKNVSVYVDNQFKGGITANYYSIPTCGTANTLTVEIPDGVHNLRFIFGPINHNKVYNNVNFSNGRACIPYLIIS